MIMGFILLLYLFVNVVLCIMIVNNTDATIENEIDISKLQERIEKMEKEIQQLRKEDDLK